MTADTTEWHRATITRTGDNHTLTTWIMLEQLALRVDQTTWDNALTATLAMTASLDDNADRVLRPSLTENDQDAVEAWLVPAPRAGDLPC